MRVLSIFVFTSITWLCFSISAQAHTRWAFDGLIKPRSNADGIKTGPCGAARTNNPTQLEAGANVSLKIESVIFHQGTFRISFSPANDTNFVTLAEGIKDYPDKQFQTVNVTLPNTTCDACTLQLIQTMPDSGPNSLYYSCADIKLVRSNPRDISPPEPITNLVIRQQDTHLNLTWSNPTTDYAKTLVLQSFTPIQAQPTMSLLYSEGDMIGNAKVVANATINQYLSQELPLQQATYFAVFAYDASANYAQPTFASSQIQPAPNSPPLVTLTAEQAGIITTQINTSTGNVVVQARVTDTNPADTHNYDWSASDYRIQDTDNNPSTLTFNPRNLSPDNYLIGVKVSDSGKPSLSSQTELRLQVSEPPAALGGGVTPSLWMLCFLTLLTKYRGKKKRAEPAFD